MNEYKLASRSMYLVFAVILPCLMVGTGVLWLWMASRPGHEVAPVWFFMIWFVGVLWGSYRSISMPRTIQVTDTGDIRLVGLFRTFVIASSNVRCLKATGAFVELKHTKGKVLLLQQFTGFHRFVTELEHANPNVRVAGI